MEVCYTACYTVYGLLLLLSLYYYCRRDGAHTHYRHVKWEYTALDGRGKTIFVRDNDVTCEHEHCCGCASVGRCENF